MVYTDSACPDAEPKCGLVSMLYLDDVRRIDQANRGKSKNDAWDREHVWPKSRGFKKQSQDGYTDLHHLRPADRNIDGVHSNYGVGMGDDKLPDGTKIESGALLDKKNQSFEPTARMVFYMATRYATGDNASSENMPDLVITKGN